LLADSHCHMDFFKNPQNIIKKMRRQKVGFAVTNSTSLQSIKASLSLSEKFPQIKCAVGIHPEDVLKMSNKGLERSFELVEENIPSASAVGEVGLDFKYAKTTQERQLQEDAFLRFIDLAKKYKKPLVVHARYAETRCLDILEKSGLKNVHMHWFTNSKKTSSRAIDLGYFISCGPILFSDQGSCEVVQNIPLSNLLLETDAPVSFGGKTSDPSWIPLVLAKVAQIKGCSKKEVQEATWANFSALYCP